MQICILDIISDPSRLKRKIASGPSPLPSYFSVLVYMNLCSSTYGRKEKKNNSELQFCDRLRSNMRLILLFACNLYSM
jgi:hypothetical protein